MLKGQGKRGGAIAAAAGFAVVLFAASLVPANAGPFSWLTGKNQQQQQHKTFICFYCSEAYLSDKEKVEYIDREH